MRSLQSKRLSKRRALIFLGLALLVLGGICCHCQWNEAHAKLADATKSSAGSATPTESSSAAPRPEASTSPSVSDEANSAAPQTTEPESKMSQIIPDNPSGQSEATDCDDKMAAAVNDYNTQTKQDKADLDNSIKFPPVGLNIIRGYVTDYNNKVTDLFNQFASQAASEHCVFPIKAPAVLPNDYH